MRRRLLRPVRASVRERSVAASMARSSFAPTSTSSRCNAVTRSAATSRVGAAIATASHGQLRIWNAATGQLRFEVKRPEVGADGLVFNPSGTIVATASRDAVRLWDAATGAKLMELPGQSDKSFTAVAFNSDGSRVATAYGKVVRLWDAATGQEILTLPLVGENLRVLALGFISDRGRLLAALSDGSIRAWEAPREKR